MSKNVQRKHPVRPSAERRQAVDPFFLFTYTLLGIALVVQFLVIVWMDLF